MSWTGEIVLSKRVVQQPMPFVAPGGDCGACVLAGLVGLTVPEIYERAREKDKEPNRQHGISHHRMIAYMYDMEREGLLDRHITDVPLWIPYEECMEYGCPSTMFNLRWFSYIRMAMDAGYYGIASVDHSKQGGPTDHWVLLCGNRTYIKYDEAGTCGTYHNELLVSCSSRSTPDEEWVDALDFLKNRGGYNSILARPK